MFGDEITQAVRAARHAAAAGSALRGPHTATHLHTQPAGQADPSLAELDELLRRHADAMARDNLAFREAYGVGKDETTWTWMGSPTSDEVEAIEYEILTFRPRSLAAASQLAQWGLDRFDQPTMSYLDHEVHLLTLIRAVATAG